jgi:putative hydroxymethylpyrimidine transport system substrate-binding protein
MTLFRKLIPAALALALSAVPAAAVDKMTVLLDWFVNPDHAPLIIARGTGDLRGARARGRAHRAGRPQRPAQAGGGRQGRDRGQLPAAAPPAGGRGPAAHRRVGTLVATPLNSLVVLADGPIQSDRRPQGQEGGLLGRRLRGCAPGSMLAQHGLGLDDVELVNVNFALSPSLITARSTR